MANQTGDGNGPSEDIKSTAITDKESSFYPATLSQQRTLQCDANVTGKNSAKTGGTRSKTANSHKNVTSTQNHHVVFSRACELAVCRRSNQSINRPNTNLYSAKCCIKQSEAHNESVSRWRNK